MLADHRHRGSAELLFSGSEKAAEQWRHSIDGEKPRCGPPAGEPLWFGAAGIRDVFAIGARDCYETLAEPVPVLDAAWSDQAGVLILRGIRLEYRDQTVGVRVGQGLPEHRVQQREKRGCRANAKSENEDRRRC